MKTARETAVELAELLTLCLTLQFEKDGVERHAPSVFASDHETFSARRVIADESYARIALDHLLAQYLPGQSLDK